LTLTLDPSAYRDLVRRALQEDIGRGDLTTQALVESGVRGRGLLVMQSPGIVAGLDVAAEAFRQLDDHVVVTRMRHDGDWCGAGETIAECFGEARALLTAERTALNFLQRLSGIATLTYRFVEASQGRITILDTRKTTPLLRELEKHAVRVGGGTNHRMRLDASVLIKDNHVHLAGGVAEAVSRARARLGDRPVEVEIESLDDLDAALDAGASTVLLDNMETADIREAVRLCRGRALTEISGGVSLARLPELSATGADFVSIGALTHSAPAADISFEIHRA
jgi:nicotinate-nucleotide pyrophosphorylase (carboxylating)